jgi:hypothetical protein
MKETDSLESRLRFWQPRRPSAKLKRRLFATPASIMPKVAWLLGSLAPVTACVLLSFSVFNSENAVHLLRREPMAAMILSNQNYAAYASDNFREAQNGLSSVTFDWTNHGGFTSSIAPFSRDTMN